MSSGVKLARSRFVVLPTAASAVSPGLLTETDEDGVTSRATSQPKSPGEDVEQEVDLSCDTHLDQEVAEERAQNQEKDMLYPAAEQE